MAEPISFILGVLALTNQAEQSSKALLDLVADIRGAAAHLKAISVEVLAFCELVFSLSIALQEEDVRTTISGKRTLMETIGSLTKPITNCRVILEQLIEKLERLHTSCSRSHDVRSTFVGVKWSLFPKNEISKLQKTLEAEKLTIKRWFKCHNHVSKVRCLFGNVELSLSGWPVGSAGINYPRAARR